MSSCTIHVGHCDKTHKEVMIAKAKVLRDIRMLEEQLQTPIITGDNEDTIV
jgi:hypothetical protein